MKWHNQKFYFQNKCCSGVDKIQLEIYDHFYYFPSIKWTITARKKRFSLTLNFANFYLFLVHFFPVQSIYFISHPFSTSIIFGAIKTLDVKNRNKRNRSNRNFCETRSAKTLSIVCNDRLQAQFIFCKERSKLNGN